MAKTKKVSDSYTAYAKPGAKLKKGANGLMSTTTPTMRQSRTRMAGERAEAPMRRRARAAAAMASAPMMKKGGKTAPKKMQYGGAAASMVPPMMKKGGSFPDLNKDGKITKADILKGRGVIKNGKSVKKARGGATLSPSGSNVSKRLSSYPKTIGKAMNGTTTPMQRRARVAAAIGRGAASRRKSRTAARPMMKHGGKAHMKKAMGGYKMMQTGGKCRGGCY